MQRWQSVFALVHEKRFLYLLIEIRREVVRRLLNAHMIDQSIHFTPLVGTLRPLKASIVATAVQRGEQRLEAESLDGSPPLLQLHRHIVVHAGVGGEVCGTGSGSGAAAKSSCGVGGSCGGDVSETKSI